jgi:hypothetical protein
MSKETRQAHTRKLAVLQATLGHDDTIAHSFGHTEGACPKCACPKQQILFCNPNGRNAPFSIPSCELDGEHLHRRCAACQYNWIERCWDQAMLAEEEGVLAAESEAAAALAAIAKDRGGITFHRDLLVTYRGWLIRFARDSEAQTVTITAEEPPPQVGTPAQIPQNMMQDPVE